MLLSKNVHPTIYIIDIICIDVWVYAAYGGMVFMRNSTLSWYDATMQDRSLNEIFIQ